MPVHLEATLLTPVTVSLSWTDSYYPDYISEYQVYWKSNTPADQDWKLLGTTMDFSFVSPQLSWSSVYQFFVRSQWGTVPEDSNIVTLFCACGHKFEIFPGLPITPGAETPDYWQMDVDIQDKVVTIAAIGITGADLIVVRIVNDTEMTVVYHDMMIETYQSPVYLKMQGLKNVSSKGPWAKTWKNGILKTKLWDESLGGWGNTFNSDNRIIVGLNGGAVSAYDMYFVISHDGGDSWDDPIYIRTAYYIQMGMREGSDGKIWYFIYNGDLAQTCNIFYYVEGQGSVLVATLTSTYGSGGTGFKQIHIEGSLMVMNYILNPGPWSFSPYIAISQDSGMTWIPKPVAGVTVFPSAYYGPIVISNGNLILFGYTTKYVLLRSTDQGDSWTEVYDFTGEYMPFPNICRMAADGPDVVFTSCKYGDGNYLAYLISHDTGLTWNMILLNQEMIGET